jgi:uncharacterized membrane protein
MIELILGLILFLGTHSLRIVAQDWRAGLISKHGEKLFKGVLSVASLLGLVLIVHGYGVARLTPQVLWVPPVATRHVAALLMLFAMILLVASQIPRNRIKQRLRHPMVISVKVWSLAHLLANGMAADVLLFGSFLLWAVFDFRAARQRERMAPAESPIPSTALGSTAGSEAPVILEPATMGRTVMTLVIGAALWMGFIAYLHLKLFGVSPLGL